MNLWVGLIRDEGSLKGRAYSRGACFKVKHFPQRLAWKRHNFLSSTTLEVTKKLFHKRHISVNNDFFSVITKFVFLSAFCAQSKQVSMYSYLVYGHESLAHFRFCNMGASYQCSFLQESWEM